jgi:HAD superfamily hydrolase (TIGR01509 family)
MSLRALLFDFDGVLADTENIHVAAWQRTFADLGWDVADEICARAAEEDDRDFVASVFAARKVKEGNVIGWTFRKQELTIAMLRDSPRLYPGVAALVQALQGRLRLAVVSGTWRANVQAVLQAARLEGAFELIIAREDITGLYLKPKPAPDPYLLALKTLNLEPSAAVALEDSPIGLVAAEAAGVRVVAVGHRRPRGDWVGSADYVENLVSARDVLDILGLE